MECQKCNLQYVGKSEWNMNIRINNHRNDVFKEDAISAIKHFSTADHNFNRDAKFTVIEQIKDPSKEKLQLREILKNREDFWMLKLQTLHPKGLNDQFNFPQKNAGLYAE